MTIAKPGKLSLYLELIRWNRPAGWLLLLWPTLSALWVAASWRQTIILSAVLPHEGLLPVGWLSFRSF